MNGAAASVEPICLKTRALLREELVKTLLPLILFPKLAHENQQINVVSTPALDVPVFAPWFLEVRGAETLPGFRTH